MNLPTTIDQSIFRAYDIRGLADTQLTPEVAYAIGRGFGTTLREMYKKKHPKVVVGRDARTHGPALQDAMMQGLVECGCTVLDIGQTPSPVNYFTICNLKADGGVQITASHNPAQYNGCKLQVQYAHAYAGEDLQTLYTKIVQKEFIDGDGKISTHEAIAPYRTLLANVFGTVGEGIKVVIDAGNGVAGPAYTNILQTLGCEVIELYTEPDGTFPNHPADPSQLDTLKELQQRVIDEGAHLGFAYDGDGDRVGLIDEQGNIRSADEILLLLAQDHLQRFNGAPVVCTVSNSSLLLTEVKKWGGKPVMCTVGHSHVEHAMQEHDALLGGEQSGHFFCGENYYTYDDALVASLRLLQILAQSGSTVSALCSQFPTVYQMPENRPHCDDDKKTAVIAKITTHFASTYSVNTLDGVRIDFGEGAWAGIRQSNTSPCISICAEARSQAQLDEVIDIVFTHLKSYPEITLK